MRIDEDVQLGIDCRTADRGTLGRRYPNDSQAMKGKIDLFGRSPACAYLVLPIATYLRARAWC